MICATRLELEIFKSNAFSIAYFTDRLHHKMSFFTLQKGMFGQIMMMWSNLMLLLLLFLPFGCGIYDRSKLPKTPKCAYTFLTESAICGNTELMAELAPEFRPGWKHINVVSSTGSFSLEGITI